MLKTKKYLVVGATVAVTLLAPPAYSDIIKCVKLDSASNMTFSDPSGVLTATHKTQGWSVPIKIVGLCDNFGSNGIGETTNNLRYGNMVTNTHCFCRLVSPAVSQWVYAGTPSDCVRGSCELRCKNIVLGWESSLTTSQQTAVRNKLFSTFQSFEYIGGEL